MPASDDHPRQSRDLIDQSKLLVRRARRVHAQSVERTERAHHTWHKVTVGRVCEVCLLTQANDEFEEESNCPGTKAS